MINVFQACGQIACREFLTLVEKHPGYSRVLLLVRQGLFLDRFSEPVIIQFNA